MNTTKQTQEEKEAIRQKWEAGVPVEHAWVDKENWFPVRHADAMSMCLENPGIRLRITPGHEPVESKVYGPSHYQGTACRDALKAMLSTEEYRGWLRGSQVKYLWRYRNKGGDEDLRKANVYFHWLQELEAEQKEAK